MHRTGPSRGTAGLATVSADQQEFSQHVYTLPGAPSRCVTSDDRHTFETFASFFWAGGWCRCLGKLNAGSAKSGYILRYVCASGTVTGCGSRWRVFACIQFLQVSITRVSITSWQHPSSAARKCKFVEACQRRTRSRPVRYVAATAGERPSRQRLRPDGTGLRNLPTGDTTVTGMPFSTASFSGKRHLTQVDNVFFF